MCWGDKDEREMEGEKRSRRGEQSSMHSRRCVTEIKKVLAYMRFVLIQVSTQTNVICVFHCVKKSSDVPIRAKDELGKLRKDRV